MSDVVEDSKDNGYLTKHRRGRKVAEAAAVYNAAGEDAPSVTTISSKNQITLPAQLLREMGLRPGDRLTVIKDGSRILLRARPKDWVRHYAGSLSGQYGGTGQDIDAYIRELRQDEGRAERIEEAWSGEGRRP